MAVQFAGSGSTGSRRRRRIVVSGDNAVIDTNYLESDGGEMESQLVASAAAGPWVPETELRIWIYSTLTAIYLGMLGFLLVTPVSIPSDIKPLADLLLSGPRPTLLIATEVTLLFLSTQLGFLIAWYRARCKLDFSGRYRVWPWAICFFGFATICRGTDLHRVIGTMIESARVLPWRGGVVGWLLPFCLIAMPLTLLLDRDVRNGRSSLWTLRLSGGMWLATAYLELFQPELGTQNWYPPALILLPLFASATLFVGLWHHARIVAYVCPDPPELDERSAFSMFFGVVALAAGSLAFWKRGAAVSEEEDESKPKRRRKKSETEEAGAKKKRKAPAKKPAGRSKARSKPADEADEAQEEISEDVEESPSEEVTETTSDYEQSIEETTAETNDSAGEEEPSWQEEEDDYTSSTRSTASNRGRANNKSKGRDTQIHESHESSVPAPHMTKSSRTWEEESANEAETSTSGFDAQESNDEDSDDQNDGGLTAEQMKGLSKRQKRELRKQLRDQERSRHR